MLVSLREPERDVASYVSRPSASIRASGWTGCAGTLSRATGALMSVASSSARGCRRPGARAAGGLPATFARPAASSCSGWSAGLLPRPRRTRRSTACTSRARCVRAQRRGRARAAGGRRDALGDSYVEHRGQAPAGRVRARHELAGAARGRRAARSACEFPGARAELMFAPVESLPFAVDLSLNARFLPNELALRVARRRIQDADQILRAESDGEQGVSDLGYERTQEARDLLRLSAGLEPTAAAARDARDRGRGARASRSSSSASRCAGGPTARCGCTGRWATSCSCSCSTSRPAHARRRLRRHAHDRAGGGDDADGHPRGRLAAAASISATRCPARASRSASTCGRARTPTATRRCSASARSERARRRSHRSSSTRAFC